MFPSPFVLAGIKTKKQSHMSLTTHPKRLYHHIKLNSVLAWTQHKTETKEKKKKQKRSGNEPRRKRKEKGMKRGKKPGDGGFMMLLCPYHASPESSRRLGLDLHLDLHLDLDHDHAFQHGHGRGGRQQQRQYRPESQQPVPAWRVTLAFRPPHHWR
jgi:hypothetical protein